MIEQDIYSVLTNDAGLSATVSTRVYPSVAPQDATKPYITYQVTGEDRDRTYGGPNGLVRGTFQLDVWHSTPRAALVVADLVRLAFDDHSQLNTGTHEIQRAKLTNRLNNWEFTISGGESVVGRVTMLFDVWYGETVPS